VGVIFELQFLSFNPSTLCVKNITYITLYSRKTYENSSHPQVYLVERLQFHDARIATISGRMVGVWLINEERNIWLTKLEEGGSD
jgi:hypothetical protein